MKWKEFPGSPAGVLHGTWGTVAVSTAHVIGEGGKQTIKCCAMQVLEVLRDIAEQNRGV